MLAGVLSISLGIAADLLLKLNYLKQLHNTVKHRNRKWKVLPIPLFPALLQNKRTVALLAICIGGIIMGGRETSWMW